MGVPLLVKPLLQSKTKKYEIYRIYNHGENCDNAEWQ